MTTSLRQLVREEHSLVDIEQQLVDEQRVNHETFAAFSNVIQEATDLVRLVSLENIMLFFFILLLLLTFYQNQIVSGKAYGNLNAEYLDLAEVFPQGYDFRENKSSVSIAPIPENVSTFIEAGFFSFVHFEKLFYGCIGNTVRKEPE